VPTSIPIPNSKFLIADPRFCFLFELSPLLAQNSIGSPQPNFTTLSHNGCSGRIAARNLAVDHRNPTHGKPWFGGNETIESRRRSTSWKGSGKDSSQCRRAGGLHASGRARARPMRLFVTCIDSSTPINVISDSTPKSSSSALSVSRRPLSRAFTYQLALDPLIVPRIHRLKPFEMKKGNRAAAQDAKKKDRLMKQQLRRARAVRKYGVRPAPSHPFLRKSHSNTNAQWHRTRIGKTIGKSSLSSSQALV